jgi:hypothetical protein
MAQTSAAVYATREKEERRVKRYMDERNPGAMAERKVSGRRTLDG